MDTPTNADEGEPGNSRQFFSRILLIPAATILVISCNTGKKTKAPPQPPPDTVAVTVQQPPGPDTILQRPVTRKRICLTFDDGPNRGTRNVLEALRSKQMPASFFIVGKHVFDSPEQLQTWKLLLEDTTIELYNHSFSHANNRYEDFYNNPAGVVRDIRLCRDTLKFNNRLVRMPGRNSWRLGKINITDVKKSKPAIDSVHQDGFLIMGWDLQWDHDHRTMQPDPDTAKLLRQIRNQLDAGTSKTPGYLVLLLHDQSFQNQENTAMLLAVLQTLKNNPEYEFITVGKYPGVR